VRHFRAAAATPGEQRLVAFEKSPLTDILWGSGFDAEPAAFKINVRRVDKQRVWNMNGNGPRRIDGGNSAAIGAFAKADVICGPAESANSSSISSQTFTVLFSNLLRPHAARSQKAN
jgi:hypothetical protein